jgi:radical SAM protein with 4Fe4S-binding SPASM domain
LAETKFPYFVDWAITARCNLSCKHCRGFPKGEVSTERARKLIDEIAELRPGWVIVEGGEPLLRPDLFELLGLMRQKGLEVHLITNGMVISPKIIAALKQLGVKVMVSIDGANKATYEAIRNGADFDTVVQSARTYATEGLLEAINITLLKENFREIPEFFDLAVSVGVNRVTIIGLKPCQDFTQKLLTPEEYGEAIKLACQAAQETGVEFFFDEPFFWPAVREWGLLAHQPAVGTGIVVSSTSACVFGEYIFIETNGGVKPCSFPPMTVGNVNDKPLDEIWKDMLASPLVQQIKDQKTRVGHCRSCQYLEDCKGCRSRTFVLTGDWLASDPVCPLSLKLAVREKIK